MKKALPILLVCVSLLVAALGWRVGRAQTSVGEKYFEETGHWVRGEFYNMYQNTPNAEELYGDPITVRFFDQTTERWVQYFENARFELLMDESEGQRVRLTDLGKDFYVPGVGIPTQEYSADCRDFPETGYRVCLSFLDFFEAHGGIAQFGYPISNSEDHNGRTVQYFEKARFEWKPDLPPGKRVALTNLGRALFYRNQEDPRLMLPEDMQGNIIEKIDEVGNVEGMLRLEVRAYPLRAVTGRDGQQTIYVIVQDQRLLPVENAQVTLVLRMPSGEERPPIVKEPTNKLGVTTHTFNVDTSSYGLVLVQVTATHLSLDPGSTATSFRVWR